MPVTLAMESGTVRSSSTTLSVCSSSRLKPEENFHLVLTPSCFKRLFANACGEPAGDHGGDKKSKQRNPVVRLGNCPCAQRGEKEKVVAKGGGDGNDDRITQPPARRQRKSKEQQS